MPALNPAGLEGSESGGGVAGIKAIGLCGIREEVETIVG